MLFFVREFSEALIISALPETPISVIVATYIIIGLLGLSGYRSYSPVNPPYLYLHFWRYSPAAVCFDPPVEFR